MGKGAPEQCLEAIWRVLEVPHRTDSPQPSQDQATDIEVGRILRRRIGIRVMKAVLALAAEQQRGERDIPALVPAAGDLYPKL